MEFINNTEEKIKYRTGNYQTGFAFFTIAPGKTVDLDQVTGLKAGLTKVEVSNEPTEVHQPVTKKEFEQGSPEDLYAQKLSEIKGLGEKSVENIMKFYPSEEVLRAAIEEGIAIHPNEKIEKKIIKVFK